MSENLDLVRSIFSAIERGDYTNAQWAEPEIEYVVVDELQPGRFRGLAGPCTARAPGALRRALTRSPPVTDRRR